MSGGARQITCFVLFQIRFHGTAPWPNVAYVSRGHGESNPCDKPGCRRLVHVPSEMCFPIANARRRAFPNACATAANMCLRFRGTPRAFTSLRAFASGEHSSGCRDGIDFRSDVVSRFYVGAQAETARHGYYEASAVGRI